MKISTITYKPETIEKKETQVSDEDLFQLFINENPFVSTFASPKDLKELAIGFLVSEGITRYRDVSQVQIVGNKIWIETREKGNYKNLIELRTSGFNSIPQEDIKPVTSNQKFNYSAILKSLKHINFLSKEWKLTGGTHSCSIFSNKGKFMKEFEDIGRHNSLDKIIGWSLINNQKLNDKFILFTGRLSSGIITKISRVGIPLVVSIKAPLSRAIKVADKLNITLIGFARYPEFTVYTNPWRIVK